VTTKLICFSEEGTMKRFRGIDPLGKKLDMADLKKVYGGGQVPRPMCGFCTMNPCTRNPCTGDPKTGPDVADEVPQK